jgi:hypothetical protein
MLITLDVTVDMTQTAPEVFRKKGDMSMSIMPACAGSLKSDRQDFTLSLRVTIATPRGAWYE